MITQDFRDRRYAPASVAEEAPRAIG